MAKQTIGDFLASLRREKGYTQQDVAEKLGISNRTISSWEQGRTYPDILSLPALAELYGVTADEILAGERHKPQHISGATENKEDTKVTEDTEDNSKEVSPYSVNILKAAYARFDSRCGILTGVGICSLLLLFFGGVSLYAIPWLGILLAVVGIIAFIAVCSLLGVFTNSAYLACGVDVRAKGEGLSPEQKHFALKISVSSTRAAVWFGWGWFAFALLILPMFLIVLANFQGGSVALAMITDSVTFAVPLFFALLFYIAAAVSSSADVKKFGTESQKAIKAKNNGLLIKCTAVACAAVVLAAAEMSVFCNVKFADGETLFSGTEDEFRQYMHTLVVSKEYDYGYDSRLADFIEEGEYVLDFTDVPSTGGDIVPVGYGFHACLNSDGMAIFYIIEESDKFYDLFTASKISVADGVYNVRFGRATSEYNSNRITEYRYSALDGVYTVEFVTTESYAIASVIAGIVLIEVGVIGAGAVYAAKRKKYY